MRRYVYGVMNRIDEMRIAGGAGMAVGGAGLWRRLRRFSGSRRTARGTRLSWCARALTVSSCGLGFVLFPGLALFVVQAGLVAVWACFMVSLIVGGLRGAGHGFR